MRPAKDIGLGVPFREVLDRMLGYADIGAEIPFGAKPNYETAGWETVLRDLEPYPGLAAEILDESALRGVEKETRRILRRTHDKNPRGAQWPADSVLARCCYLVCRLIRPSIVVETGVAHGVSSAFILTALEQNGHGALHSVDLPPLRESHTASWGVAVPDALKARWVLHRGASARVLPGLLEELGTVDVFLHDSLHTHRNMRREFEVAWPQLRPGGILLADDVERNRAFGELQGRKPSLWRVVKDVEERPLYGRAAPIVFGVAMKRAEART
ncbi:MAG: class I SAM-dependent methyltransferase [Rubrobacter sp.]|nr:class I SAM-dependent methyltransferase [Rubrobacter sp.]